MTTTTAMSITPLDDALALKERTYQALKQAISATDIYLDDREHRLDERQLSEQLGVSRTPLREALARLEQEGLVTTVPRRGTFIARKSKREIIDMVLAWAALESMAVRLATERASDAEIATLRQLFATFDDDRQPQAHIDEYSVRNIEFHQTLLRLGGCELICQMADNLFLHMRAIRVRTIGDRDRASRSIIDHINIIEAIERRDTGAAEHLARDHTLELAAHIERHVHYLD